MPQEETISQIVEAILFSSRHSLTSRQIATIAGIKEARKIRPLIDELNAFYKEHQRSFSIQRIAGGYLLCTEPRFSQWVKRGQVERPVRLSPSVLETLAIVAYKQPINRAEIESIRTVDATYAIRSLLEKRLIKVVGREEIPGRPLLYGTTKQFLEHFGFNSLKELPRLEDFDILVNHENVHGETELEDGGEEETDFGESGDERPDAE